MTSTAITFVINLTVLGLSHTFAMTAKIIMIIEPLKSHLFSKKSMLRCKEYATTSPLSTLTQRIILLQSNLLPSSLKDLLKNLGFTKKERMVPRKRLETSCSRNRNLTK